MAPCPCLGHGQGKGDNRPSLSIGDGDDGRLLVHCFAGCDQSDVIAALRARGIWEGGGTMTTHRRARTVASHLSRPISRT